MFRPTLPLLLVLALTGSTSAHAAAPPRYFPDSFAEDSQPCPANSFPYGDHRAIMSPFSRGWYTSHLAAAGEPSLFELSQTSKSKTTVVRFTWLRSFDAPIVVRVELPASGKPVLIAKELSGKGGYAPGAVARQISRKLDAKETGLLRAALAIEALDKIPPVECDIGLDGAEWVIERVDGGGYHYLQRWSPSDGAVREFGLLLLGFTGWRPSRIY